ncbi:MAG: hypothetical protein ACI9BD_000108 [Candidatus Marinamargulisbacteria bacterium]|jgi:hypothetical protein
MIPDVSRPEASNKPSYRIPLILSVSSSRLGKNQRLSSAPTTEGVLINY